MEDFEYITLTKMQYDELLNSIRLAREPVKVANENAKRYKEKYENLLKQDLNELALSVTVSESENFWKYVINTNSEEIKDLNSELEWHKRELKRYMNITTRYEKERLNFNRLPWYKKIFYKISKP